MTEEKKRSSKWWIVGGVIIIVIILLLILLWPRETYVSDGGQVSKVDSLKCSTSHLEETFFDYEDVQRYTHEIRAIFRENELDDISYIFNGTYNSPETVESVNARLHAKYNKYMGENSANPEALNPQFSNLGSKLQISLYGNKSKLNDITAQLFFLNKEEVQKIEEYNLDKLEKLYKDKGFSCVKI